MNLLYKLLLIFLVLLPLSICYAEPAVKGAILTFYVTDPNLSTDHRAIMTIPTAGLVDFTINGVSISGPDKMVETGIDTGTFQIQLTLPDTVNGKPVRNGDVVLMTYHQKADYSGNPATLTQSKVLSSVPSNSVSGSSSNVRIGQYFTLRIHAPNYNLDSFKPDDIPLDTIEFHMGGVQTTLSDPAFQTTPYTLRETGPNTDTFEVNVKIPRSVDGFPVDMGASMEFRFKDAYAPSSVFVTVGGTAPSSSHEQNLSPVIPAMMSFYADNSLGAKIDYGNSSLVSSLQSPICSPPPGSFFMVGKTTVTCAAKDQNGNSVIKTFTVNVEPEKNKIPHWAKKTVGFWCNGDISDDQMISVMKYLVSKNVMLVSGDSAPSANPDKTTLCMWAGGKASDQDVSNSLYLLSR